MPDRLTPDDLARLRAEYRQCEVTIVPILEECMALASERDAARAEAEGLRAALTAIRARLEDGSDWMLRGPWVSEFHLLITDALAGSGRDA